MADYGSLSRLVRRADSVAASAASLVERALRDVRGEIANLSAELNLAGSADDRERAYAAVRGRMAELASRLDRLLSAQNDLAARTAAKSAAKDAGVEVKFSARRAEAVIETVTPAQGDSLAAVFTDRMAQSLVNSLREATVSVLREQAVSGGSLKSMADEMRKRWTAAAANGRPRFTDAGGREWDTETYFQMSVRTNTMRVYNDCLVDDLARATSSDLVRVSTGGSDPHCACAAWEGAILSVSGKTRGFPTYEQARQGGCFHPNCVHTLEAVDEFGDADEIARQRRVPFDADAAGGDLADAQDERKYRLDVAERMERDGLAEAEARLAVDRANLAASVRAGLLRDDADALVAKLTDAQVAALVRDGDPPQFAPVKRVKGGTRKEPKYEAERWRRGSRGGVVHVSRDATAERIAEVCGVKDAKADADGKAKPKDKDPFAHAPIPEFKTAREGMKYVSDTLGVHCAGFEKFDSAFVRDIAEAVADVKAHIGESDRLKGVWTCAEYYAEMLEVRKQEHLAAWDLSNVDKAVRKEVEKVCEDSAKRDLRKWGVTKTMSPYGRAWRGWSGSFAQFNGIVLNNRLDKMDRTGEVKSGFKAEGCEKPISTVYHELGHIIDYHLRLNRIGGSGTPQNETLKRICADTEAVKTSLSRYGAKNPRETVAEAWAEYKMNPNPREIALAIGREIDILSRQRIGKGS